ncbi:acyl-coenzyme A synthetase/AMP-(fatty) acid ligase [Bradyrhizobium sp. S3.14.4]
MYPGQHARLRPLQPAFIMAATGEAVTYRELDARSNRLAHLFRKHDLKRLDHYSIFMENNSRYLEACGAGERSGLYYTCINSFLTPGELAYLLVNSQSENPDHVRCETRHRPRGDQGLSGHQALHRRRRPWRERPYRRPRRGDRRPARGSDRR